MVWTRSTRAKLLSLIAVMTLGSALVGAVGLVVFGRMERQETELSAKLLPSLMALSEVQNATAEVRFWSTRAIVLVSQKQLEKLKKNGYDPKKTVISYCHVGLGRGSFQYLALRQAGVKNVKVYVGSWDEWGNDPSLPLAAQP